MIAATAAIAIAAPRRCAATGTITAATASAANPAAAASHHGVPAPKRLGAQARNPASAHPTATNTASESHCAMRTAFELSSTDEIHKPHRAAKAGNAGST